jgi:hypothetical protein
MQARARICKSLRMPEIDSGESILPGWESIPGLLKRFTNTGTGVSNVHWHGWNDLSAVSRHTMMRILSNQLGKCIRRWICKKAYWQIWSNNAA